MTRRKRVFVAAGRPWKDALIAYLEPRSPYRPWTIAGDLVKGDLLVTILDTTPRTFLCVERVSRPPESRKPVEVVEHTPMPTLPAVSEIERWARVDLPSDGLLSGDDGTRLLDVLDAAVTATGFNHGEDTESSAASARILLHSKGVCTGCSRTLPLHRRTARDAVHIHTVVWSRMEASKDWPAALCDKCADAMTDGEFAGFLDYRFSLHPRCPRCDATRTMAVRYGMMPAPSSRLSSPPWITDIGCCITDDTPKWVCGLCDYGWQFEIDARFHDSDAARTGDRVRALLFNFDGRHNDGDNIWPPDVANPHEPQVGTLEIERVSSAWGGYVRYAIVRDDGALREIEPDTIVRAHRTGI